MIEEFVVDELDDQSTQPEDKGDETEKVDVEEEEVVVKTREESEGVDEISSVRGELTKLQERVLALAAENNELKKQKDAPAVEPLKGEKFTDAQLLQVLKDNADNPDVLFGVMKQMASQIAQETGTKFVQEEQTKGWRTHMGGINRQFLETNQWAKKPEVTGQLSDVKARLGLEDHPAGDVLATGVLVMKMLEEQETKTAMENSRVKDTKATKTLDKTKKESGSGKLSYTPEQKAMAKKFGVPIEDYMKFAKEV